MRGNEDGGFYVCTVEGPAQDTYHVGKMRDGPELLWVGQELEGLGRVLPLLNGAREQKGAVGYEPDEDEHPEH
jgi:hypothetical protein